MKYRQEHSGNELRIAREKRDATIEKAHQDFEALLADAYLQGMSLTDIHMATGMAVSTLRVKLKMAGVVIRPTGRVAQGKT